MMASLGRGGEGQRIRDEILNIMHRHHIKEVSGHFMEEWHQKLHNNTTPDDVVICEAYIKFLESGGSLDVYYETLEKGGVSRERLESFERPILTPPDFVPHLKDALIHDFYEFLRLLRSIHSGTDLESALNAARYILGGELAEKIEGIWRRKDDPGGARDTARARGMLKPLLEGETGAERARDMLYLDLALEEFFRVVVEKNIHAKREREELAGLMAASLENQRLTCDDEEFSACSRWWSRLMGAPPSARGFALHAKAVTERLGRSVGSYIDRYYGLFQPKAEFLGEAFDAEAWTVTLFTEELVRGRPAFTLSQVLRHLDPALRREAELGNWQVISPGRATGRVEVVKDLGSVQGGKFKEAAIILAEKVKGDEEPPEGVTAVITPDSTDIVSHVAVRARNSHLLFATCYDAACFEGLKAQEGHVLTLSVNPSGDVVYEEAGEEPFKERVRAGFSHTALPRPEFRDYAVSLEDFNGSLVGGKSMNIKRLMDWKDRFPEDVRFPRSAAVPFGVFERVFEADINREMAGRCRNLMGRLEEGTEERLGELRAALLELEAPGELLPSLKRAMEEAGLPWAEDPEGVWDSIKRVWASKWNHRAYLSRKALGIPHEDIYMAVLVQEVMDPEYAFVAHTANPFTGKKDELYAELVPGLGETLVGNYPGRAMGFVFGKDGQGPRLTAYPSKSTALRGGGLIFRSDSNGEDLAGYAGAGLYESVMLENPAETAIDYAEEPIMWDNDLRDGVLGRIAETCVIVEGLFGAPQDIEGACAGGIYHIVQSRPQVGAFDG
jgi:alpha-glucan,water dikinase